MPGTTFEGLPPGSKGASGRSAAINKWVVSAKRWDRQNVPIATGNGIRSPGGLVNGKWS